MRNLVSLRHLHFNDPELVPAEVRFLTRLQTLSVFVVGPDHMVEELGCLNELKGELKICKLEQVRDKEEAKKAKLREKRMDRLVLEWSDEDNRNVNNEGALEGLQPHPDIRSLTIKGYGGEKFSSWMSTLQHNNLMPWDVPLQVYAFITFALLLPQVIKLLQNKALEFIFKGNA
ncbi:DISEASE RESISTANCE PROTEIN RP [Salix purpurea]|uniref:DISEASE RESISTANCE PROTEIN RP n=1 Tax=Salix purpurea TaxID=77065 RepID=A0A9Q0UQM2_SALPP|nr:DISEASE RESISTANCE PROTEIN RP [Salix purpurea]